MYAEGNPKTKKALKELIAAGNPPAAFSPGPFPCKENGVEFFEGPHYPKAHTWYAKCQIESGRIVKVLS
jgi:hypothetical protein